MLKVNNLSAGYGKVNVLHGISLEVNERECVALIGANGAGKSTLSKMLVGLLKPSFTPSTITFNNFNYFVHAIFCFQFIV